MSLRIVTTYHGTPVDDLTREQAIDALKTLAANLPRASKPAAKPLRYCGTLVGDMCDADVIQAARTVDPSYRGCLLSRREAVEVIQKWRDGPYYVPPSPPPSPTERYAAWRQDIARFRWPDCPSYL